MIPMLLLSVLLFQDSQPASQPATYTQEVFQEKVEAFATQFRVRTSSLMKIEELHKRIVAANEMMKADPETAKNFGGLLEDCRVEDIRYYNAIVELRRFWHDQIFVASVKKYGSTQNGWYGVSLGRGDGPGNTHNNLVGVAVAIAFYDGPPIAAAKITGSWQDAFGDSVGKTVKKTTDIRTPPKTPLKEQPVDENCSLETVLGLIQKFGDTIEFEILSSDAVVPSHVSTASSMEFKFSVTNVKKK